MADGWRCFRCIAAARNVITVEPVLFLYMLGSFLQFTAVQQLIRYKVCMINYNDTVLCNNLTGHKEEEDEVIKQASHWIIILNVALTVPSVISSLFLGSWSDAVGRKSIILLPTVGTIIYCGFLIVSAAFTYLSVWIIIAGQAILGATGAFAILTSAVFSYLGDVTTKENRTLRFGILESMTFLGSFVGNVTGGVIIDRYGYITCFIFIISCEVVIIIYVVVWLKESVSQYGRQGMTERIEVSVEADLGQVEVKNKCIELLRVDHFKKAVLVIFQKRPQKRRLQIIFLVVCLFIFELVGTGARDTTVLYVTKEPLSWNATLVGLFLGLKNLSSGFGLLCVLPLVHFIGLGDPIIAAGSTVVRMCGYILMAFARTTTVMFLVIVPMAVSGIPAACTRAMLSKLVLTSEQGSLFSFAAAVETTTTFLGSFIFNAIFPATLDILQGGFIYLLMAAMLVVPVILLLWVRDLKKYDNTYQIQEEAVEEYTM